MPPVRDSKIQELSEIPVLLFDALTTPRNLPSSLISQLRMLGIPTGAFGALGADFFDWPLRIFLAASLRSSSSFLRILRAASSDFRLASISFFRPSAASWARLVSALAAAITSCARLASALAAASLDFLESVTLFWALCLVYGLSK